MKTYQIRIYSEKDKDLWNSFVADCKNATFLFHRDFMDYHQHRFEDYSLMVFDKEKLKAILPANRVENKVFSHQGLSYGGMLYKSSEKLASIMTSFKTILNFLEQRGIQALDLKLTPKIYHTHPSDEIDYLMFLLEARLTRRDIASVISKEDRIPIQSNRKDGVRKAKKQGLELKEGLALETFWNNILIPNLKKRHKATPVHSLVEIEALAEKFPNQIQQFSVYKENTMVAATILFITPQVVHVQYISSTEDRQQLGSLDFLFYELIQHHFENIPYFDFGISNEAQGKHVNQGLQYWKECFGGRGIVHDFYTIDPKMHQKLDQVFI